MAKFFNRVGVAIATTGTGDVTCGSALTDTTNGDYYTPAEAGVANGNKAKYLLQEGGDTEIGIGTYTSSGTTFSRDTVTKSKIAGTAGTTKLTLAGAAKLYLVPLADDQKWTGKSDGSAWAGDVDSSGGPTAAYASDWRIVTKWGTGHTQFDQFAIWDSSSMHLQTAMFVRWNSSYPGTGSPDTGLARGAAGLVHVTDGNSSTTYRDMKMRDLYLVPSASLTPANNGDLRIEATSNTTLTFKLKGSDGTVRSGTITLA